MKWNEHCGQVLVFEDYFIVGSILSKQIDNNEENTVSIFDFIPQMCNFY